ncbi:MAG: hypothetical protein FD129_2279, partial [bacterium]
MEIIDPNTLEPVRDTDFRGGYIGFWVWTNNVECHYDDVIITPPVLEVQRDIPNDLVNGGSGTVTLDVRVGDTGTVDVTEVVPAGLVPSAPSNGGVLNGQTIEWKLGQIAQGLQLSYTLGTSKDSNDVRFVDGSATFNGESFLIGGDTFYTGSPFTDKGFIKLWNHLGPLAWQAPAVAGDDGPPGACDANGGADLGLDWIVNDGATVTEANVTPFPGMVTRPKYG